LLKVWKKETFLLSGVEDFWEADLWTLFIYKCDICDIQLFGEKDLWKHRQLSHSNELMSGFITEVDCHIWDHIENLFSLPITFNNDSQAGVVDQNYTVTMKNI
jgi:hypothetical protein